MFAFFKLFGVSDLSARLTSILAALFAVPFVYILAKELYDRDVAVLSSLVFLLTPWVVLLSGRAQTDMLMTAFMVGSISCFVYAYNRKTSFMPFGILFGLALFTKQPSILILVIVVVWVILSGDLVKVSKKLPIPILIGLAPITVYALYHVINGSASGIMELIYGEAVYRTPLFSNYRNTLAGMLVGISPLVILFSFYEVLQNQRFCETRGALLHAVLRNRVPRDRRGLRFRQVCKSGDWKNILVVWLVVYGLFVLARTPQSHEYYILPLSVPFAILSSKGVFSLKKATLSRLNSKKRFGVLIAVLLLASTIPVSYVFLSYTGDLGYTCTEDVISYLSTERGTEVLVLTPNRYERQLCWYSEVRGGSGINIASITNDLSSVSVNDVVNVSEKATLFHTVMELHSINMSKKQCFLDGCGISDSANISENTSAPEVFLAIDDRGGLDAVLDQIGYEKTYSCTYRTALPSVFGSIYTGEESGSEYFEQCLYVYRLK